MPLLASLLFILNLPCASIRRIHWHIGECAAERARGQATKSRGSTRFYSTIVIHPLAALEQVEKTLLPKEDLPEEAEDADPHDRTGCVRVGEGSLVRVVLGLWRVVDVWRFAAEGTLAAIVGSHPTLNNSVRGPHIPDINAESWRDDHAGRAQEGFGRPRE